MKFKNLILLFLLPVSLMAANTNINDNLLIRNTLQFLGGTPGANKVLTSDAGGYYTPQSIIALDATIITNITETVPYLSISGQGTHVLALTPVGTVITNNASPTFVATTTTSLNGLIPGNLITNATLVTAPYLTLSGIGGNTLTITGNGTVITNNSSPTFNALTVTTLNGMPPAPFVTNISSTTLTVTGQGTHTINVETPLVNANTVTNITGDALHVFSGTGTKVYTMTINYGVFGVVTNGSSPSFGGLTVNGNSTFGLNSSSTTTLVGQNITATSGFNVNSGVFSVPPTTAGNITNGATTIILGANLLATIDTLAATNLTETVNGGAGTKTTRRTFVGLTNFFNAVTPIMNTWITNINQETEIRCGVSLPSTIAANSTVGFFHIKAGVTNRSFISSYAGVGEVVTNMFGPFTLGSGELAIFTNINVTGGTPTLDASSCEITFK